jgi:hypothetical protein
MTPTFVIASEAKHLVIAFYEIATAASQPRNDGCGVDCHARLQRARNAMTAERDCHNHLAAGSQ